MFVRLAMPVWCLGQDVEFDCIGSRSLHFYLLIMPSYHDLQTSAKVKVSYLTWVVDERLKALLAEPTTRDLTSQSSSLG